MTLACIEARSFQSADQEAQTGVGLECAKEDHLISKDFIVKEPAFQIGDRRGLALLVGAVDDEQAEEAGPSGFQVGLRCLVEPDLMLVAFVVGRPARVGWDHPRFFRGF